MTQGLDNKTFLRHLHAFRGFAITNVVAIHAWGDQVSTFGGYDRSLDASKVWVVNEALFHSSTSYFALISGILFALVLRTRGWTAFFRGKMLNVVSPYIVMTLLFTLYGLRDNDYVGMFEGGLGDYVATVAANLWTGGASYQFWYIPIFIVLCLATPLLAWLLEQPRARWLVVLIVLAPLVVSRTVEVSWASVVYYLGVYTAGMVVGNHYRVALGLFRRYWWVSLIAAGLCTLALLFFLDVDAVGFVSIRETLFYVQKLAIAAVVIVLFHANEERLPEWLSTVAAFAFSIFFLHVFILTLLSHAQARLGLGSANLIGILVAGLLFLVAAIVLSIALSRLAQRALGKRSRLLIGA